MNDTFKDKRCKETLKNSKMNITAKCDSIFNGNIQKNAMNDKERKKWKKMYLLFSKACKKRSTIAVLFKIAEFFLLLPKGIVLKEKYKSLNIDVQKVNKYERTTYRKVSNRNGLYVVKKNSTVSQKRCNPFFSCNT